MTIETGDRRFYDAVGFALANLQKPSLKLSVYQKEALKNTHSFTFPQFATIILFEPGRTSSGISGLAEDGR